MTAQHRTRQLGAWMAVLVGCSNGSMSPAGPGDAEASDAASDAAGNVLTISLFRTRPFVDGDTENASLVAVQDGDGAWNAVEGDQGIYRVPVTSTRFGYAIGCITPGFHSVVITQKTVAEGLTVRELTCNPVFAPSVEIQLAVRGAPPRSQILVRTRGDTQLSGGGSDTVYQLRVSSDPGDVLVTMRPSSSDPSAARIIRFHDHDPRVQPSLSADFSMQGTAPEVHSVSVDVGPDGRDPDESVSVTNGVVTRDFFYQLGTGESARAPGLPTLLANLPLALRQPGDRFSTLVSANGEREGVFFTRTTHNSRVVPGELAVELPRKLAVSPPVVSVEPGVRLTYAFPDPVGDPALRTIELYADSANEDGEVHQWIVTTSGSWLVDKGHTDYSFPDLSAVDRYTVEYGLLDRNINWAVSRVEKTTGPADDRSFRDVLVNGTLRYCGDGIIQPPETCEPPGTDACSETCIAIAP